MTGAEILALIGIASRLVTTGMGIYEKLNREGRDKLTPEELAEIKAAQGLAESGWAAQLKKLREAD